MRIVLPLITEAYQKGADSVATSEHVSEMTEKARGKAGSVVAKAAFTQWVDTLRPQWLAEAESGIALINELNAKREAKQNS